jgi:cell division protein FtsL
MIKNVCAILLAIGISLSLFIGVWQTSRYSRLESEVMRLEGEQYDVITANRRLISGITVLSTPERIEKVAERDLGMRKARPEEIMRIELKKGGLGG